MWGVPNASENLHSCKTQDLGLLESGRMILLQVYSILSKMKILIAMYIRLSFLDEWDTKYCMDTPSIFHLREYSVIKSQIHNADTPTYKEALWGKNAEKYFKEIDD